MRILILFSSLLFVASLMAQDSSFLQKKKILSTQSILLVKVKYDSTQFKTPKYKQGFFCNFEDQLNRKKVPVDFSLGKSKY